MSTEGFGASRSGDDGDHNEDAFLVDDGLGLYLVCDGASDATAGEVAAKIARDAVAASVARSGEDLDVRLGRVARFVVEKAMREALHALGAAEENDPALGDLATTVTLLLVHRRLGIIGHRGDSRAYLIRRQHGHQLTVDHELTEAPEETAPSTGAFDVFAVEFRPRDTIVLCTDGAEEIVEQPATTRVAGNLSPHVLARQIVAAAHRRDAKVDATAVVVRVRGDREPGWLALSRQPRRTNFGHVLEPA